MAATPPNSPFTQPVDFSKNPQDDEHINLLSIGCTVMGILIALFHSFPLIHVVLGFSMLSGSGSLMPRDTTSTFAGVFFVLIGAAIVLFGWVCGGFIIYAGRCLKRRENKTLIQIMAALLCLFMPFGTVLGVFIFIVLSRPSVAAQFETKAVSSHF